MIDGKMFDKVNSTVQSNMKQKKKQTKLKESHIQVMNSDEGAETTGDIISLAKVHFIHQFHVRKVAKAEFWKGDAKISAREKKNRRTEIC